MKKEQVFSGKTQSRYLSAAKIVCLSFLFSIPVETLADSVKESPAVNVVQQQGMVKGTVVDAQGEPIIGASVAVKGGAAGTITDMDGKFSLSVPKGSQIVISFIGYVRQFITPKPGEILNITLKEDAQTLDEVVVVGYGTQKMKNVTGAIATVNTKEIADLPVGNLAAALQGQMNGVSISGGDTRPGSQASITVRQPFSLSKDGGTTEPIYVIDDFIADGTAFNNLDVNEVESITVLKDAAASVYGARGAQGAVLVKTKRGKIGRPRISYSGQFGFADEVGRAKMMSAYDYGIYYNRFMGVSGRNNTSNMHNTYFQPDELETMKSLNYDWLDEAWKTAFTQKHNLNVSGGAENANYFASISYFDQTGNLGTLDYNRWNYRAGVDLKIANHLKVALQVSGNMGHSEKTFNKIGGENDENDYLTLSNTPRYYPFLIGGESYVRIGPSGKSRNALQQYNFFQVQDCGDQSINDPNNMQINGSAEYDFDWVKPLKGLKVKFSYSKSISNNKFNQHGTKLDVYYLTKDQMTGSGGNLYEGIADAKIGSNWKPSNGNRLLRDMERTESYQMNFNIMYNRTFGKHTVGALFSIERTESENEKVRFWREAPLLVDNGQSNSATGSKDGETTRSEAGNLSYIGRVNYSYADRYLAEFLIRSDASTKFAPENYWGVFPSLSLGWVMSEEAWFKEKLPWVDFLKVRGSFGIMGKDNTKPWLWRQRYTSQANKGAVFGTSSSNDIGWGLKMEAAPNRNATWDKAYKWNFGIDSKFLDNRLSVGIDAYYDKNTDMLVQRDAVVPITIGGAMAAENYDGIDTYGVELSLGWRDRIGEVDYFVRMNTGWRDARYRKKDWPEVLTYDAVYENGPVDMGQWGYNCLGMFRTQEDIDAYVNQYGITSVFGSKTETLKPGMLYYRDVRGPMKEDGTYEGPDGIIDDNDKIQLTKKKSNPYGFTLNFGGEWKGFSLKAQLAASWGGFSEIPSDARCRDEKKLEYNNMPAFMSDMFSEEVYREDGDGNKILLAPANLNARYPNMANESINNVTSDFWQVSSFRLTLKNISLGYSLPRSVVEKVGISGCRFSATAVNVLSLFNPYPDNFIDPMSSYGKYPALRTVTFGVNLTF